MRAAFLVFSLVVLPVSVASAAPPNPAGLEFFEQKIRPVLVKHCYACHSVAAKKRKGGLLLDSREAIRKGGERGPGVVPGEPDKSYLLKAVRYEADLEMPPKDKGKLPDRVIADLEKWVKIGAPDPREAGVSLPIGDSWQEILKERRGWWSLQPVRKPNVPTVKNEAWSADPIDRFLLAELEKHGLSPGGDAERRTLIRRLSFVLTGLPPAPEEVEAFVADPSPTAYERLVDRLLASPHFGERFAQHWLDMVRFSETHGNEWNYETPFAWRYRDYVIRAFNQDVPYHRFVREHIAGDLLAPRWNSQGKFNEAPIGTMFYRFGDANVETCIEFPVIGYDTTDNQIDTLGKAFQATTIACARCHDHKLDAVSMKDYYALVGILRSSRQMALTLDGPDVNVPSVRQIREIKADIRQELGELWRQEAEEIGRYLLAAQACRAKSASAAQLAQGLDPARLDRWVEALAAKTADDLLAPWRLAGSSSPKDFAAAWRKQAEHFTKEQHDRAAFNRTRFRTFADFRTGSFAGWQVSGYLSRGGPSPAGDFALHADGDALVKAVLPAGCFTHTLSDRLNGALRSPVLSASAGKYISYEVLGGSHSEVRVVSHGCQFADDRNHWHRLGEDRVTWVTQRMPTRRDADGASYSLDPHPYVELMTKFDNPRFPDPIVGHKAKTDKDDYLVPWDKAVANPRSSFGITRVVLHDEKDPPKPELSHLGPLFAASMPATPAEAAERYAAVVKAAVQVWSAGQASDDDVRWIDGLLQRGLLSNRVGRSPRLAELAKQYRGIESKMAVPYVVPGMADFGPGIEHLIFPRGDCLQPTKERAPRRFLEVLSKPGDNFLPTGSGRLELAQRIAAADNPLTARVMVNRLWQHAFGQGIVRTVDDFGHNGDRPSHPELLDYLAARFVEDGWSMKHTIRTLVLTRTFRLTNRPAAAARDADPENRWLHHFAPRRMEAEAIRDNVLFASGRLDLTMYGPGVDPFRERQIPHQRLFIGPLDGNGRRSLYVKHTLMEPPKFLEAFNLPKGVTMQGRRDVTNVPAQALAMLNDPFLVEQADGWAKRLTDRKDRSIADRIDHMFVIALGRLPNRTERERWETAVQHLAEKHTILAQDVLASRPVWKDVAHAMFNLKEFIYVP